MLLTKAGDGATVLGPDSNEAYHERVRVSVLQTSNVHQVRCLADIVHRDCLCRFVRNVLVIGKNKCDETKHTRLNIR